MVVYDNKCETNISNFDNNLRFYCHEEADTLIVLHGIDVAKRDPFQEVYIDFCDTDVFLLLLYYDKLCMRTIFNDKNDCVDIGMLYKALDKEKVRALSGFYTFTGCDQTSKFRGFSKETCWKTFINLPGSCYFFSTCIVIHVQIMLTHLDHGHGTCSQSTNMKGINYPLQNMLCYI